MIHRVRLGKEGNWSGFSACCQVECTLGGMQQIWTQHCIWIRWVKPVLTPMEVVDQELSVYLTGFLDSLSVCVARKNPPVPALLPPRQRYPCWEQRECKHGENRTDWEATLRASASRTLEPDLAPAPDDRVLITIVHRRKMLTQGSGSSHCISSTTSQQGHAEERHNLCSPHFIFCFEDLLISLAMLGLLCHTQLQWAGATL